MSLSITTLVPVIPIPCSSQLPQSPSYCTTQCTTAPVSVIRRSILLHSASPVDTSHSTVDIDALQATTATDTTQSTSVSVLVELI